MTRVDVLTRAMTGTARPNLVSFPHPPSEPHMTPTTAKKHGPAFHLFLVLFTIFGIPIIIATPFLLAGFLGRP